jgi:4-hydroxy-3-polyprenylbenzoate decarboxylase
VKLVVCVTGASGSIYARRVLSLLAQRVRDQRGDDGPGLEVAWVTSSNASEVWRVELGEDMPPEIDGLRRYERYDFQAPFASGSNAPDAVLVFPCSMSTLARVAHGGGDDLISRTCEVALKERRKLILVTRETPLSLVHLRNMVAATEAGAVILPAVPSFYSGIDTLRQAVDTVVERALQHAGLSVRLRPAWGSGEAPRGGTT